jgi:SAM-dependent methyltransferase
MTRTSVPSTISYYNRNSESFIESTLEVDVSELYSPFLKSVPRNGRILDLGCGSGRDTRYFVENSYDVVAVDASSEMVAATRNVTSADVRQMRFDEIVFRDEFDGIWACASLLHVPKEGLADILRLCVQALRPQGVIYVSFKYGTSEREAGGRFFCDMDEEGVKEAVGNTGCDLSISQWVTFDNRPSRANERWLNAILSKK